jgi:HlyD family secretion protein
MRRRKTAAWIAVAVIALVSIALFAGVRQSRFTPNGSEIPVAEVKRGDLDLKIYTTGELRVSHSSMLTAPPVAGGALQITHLLRTGTPVKKDDVVVQFDTSEQQYKVEQSRSEMLQAEQEIIKAKADAAVQAAKDKVALLKAQFDVRRAELEVGKNELASTIDAKKNDLALVEAKRALAQLEQDLKSHTASGQATIAVADEKANKARLAMQQAQQSIEKMTVRAPMDGLIAIEKNLDSTGGMFWGGMAIPDYREGDQTQPGSTIAQVIDLAELEVSAKIDERDRSNIKIGQPVEIQLDALPGHTFRGTVKTVGNMARRNFWEDATAGRFDIMIQLPNDDPRLRAGFTAQVVIRGDVRKDVLYVPRQAVFLKDGKRVIYVKNSSGFEPHEVKIQVETESRAAIDGLKLGEEVALIDPALPRKAANTALSEASVGGRQ